LIRQLLIESFLLSALGGLVGLVFAFWGSTVLVSMMQTGQYPIILDLHPDLKVLSFNAALCLLTGLLFGLAPALRATTRVDLTPSLKQSAANLEHRRERLSLTKTLVISQVALSLVLLFGAGLFVRTLVNLVTLDVGFQRENLLLFGVAPVEAGYQGHRFAALCQEIQSRVAALPGVRSATASMHLLLSGSSRGNSITVPGYAPAPRENMSIRVLPVGTDFLTTMGIPLLIGRDLTARDDEKAPKVSLINESMAHRFWANQNPIGKHFRMANSDFEVVGVVRDAKYDSLRRDVSPTVYHPFVQTLDTMRHMHFEVRTVGDAKALIPEVSKVVTSVDKRLPLFDVLTQEQQIDALLLQERLFAKLTGAFGLLALVLVCVGLYGITSYALARRTKEIGIRMAVGAQPGTVLGMVLREVLAMTGIGVLLGVAASYLTARLAASMISGLLFGLKITDVAPIAVAALAMIAVALMAGLGPARRASRVDPTVALREE
jgi:predicted permease